MTSWGGGGPDEGPAAEVPALIDELVNAWAEVLSINPHARQNGGVAHRRVWAAIDALAMNREKTR